MTTGNCFTCGQAGHWASECGKQACRKCSVPLHLHTDAGITECAWRGQPCTGCGFPPHPDGAAGRCDRYSHPSDTAADRYIRSRTPWHRSMDPDCFYRMPNRRPPDPRPDPAGDLAPWRGRAEELMSAARTLGH